MGTSYVVFREGGHQLCSFFREGAPAMSFFVRGTDFVVFCEGAPALSFFLRGGHQKGEGAPAMSFL